MLAFVNDLCKKFTEYYYRHKFKHCGKNVVIEKGVVIIHPENISIGNNVHLRRGCMLYAQDASSSNNYQKRPYIKIGDGTHIKENVILNTYGGSIILGCNVNIGQNSVIYGNGGVKIGNNSGIGPLSLVVASNHIFKNSDIPFTLQGESKHGIFIDDNVWCAGNVVICDGVKIEKGAVIGAGAVIRKHVRKNAVVLGNPAEVAYYHDN